MADVAYQLEPNITVQGHRYAGDVAADGSRTLFVRRTRDDMQADGGDQRRGQPVVTSTLGAHAVT